MWFDNGVIILLSIIHFTMMSAQRGCQAIILAGGGGSRLYPLNAAGLPKVLMPVANRPLLTFPLRMLEEGGISDVFVVCEGDAVATQVRHWVNKQSTQLHIEVFKVAEGQPSVAALRHAIDRVRSENFVLMSGDVITEVPLRAQLLMHQVKGSTVTALFGRRKNSPAADTQPGKAPRNVDYVGLSDGDRLVFFNHSPEPAKELRLPQAALCHNPNLAITTKLVDMQVYIFRTQELKTVLDNRPELLKLEDHLLPYLVTKQALHTSSAASPLISSMLGSYSSNSALNDLVLRSSSGALDALMNLNLNNTNVGGSHVAKTMVVRNSHKATNSAASAHIAPTGTSGTTEHIASSSSSSLKNAASASSLHSPSASITQMPSHNGNSAPSWVCTAYVAPEGSYCQRANTLQGYADVNRDAVTFEYAPKLLRETPSARSENFVASGVAIGTKATVGSGCMVGPGSTIGDKTNVKRSVIGCDVHLGTNVKVINSVLQDKVHIGDNCHIQNSIVCEGCVIQGNAQMKDCQIGPGFVVPSGSVLKSEVMSLAGGSHGK